jgi:leucyl aminopeptidase
MRCIIKDRVDDKKPLAVIAFSQEQTASIVNEYKLEKTISLQHLEKWDFSKDTICHFHTVELNHIFVYQIDKDFEIQLFLKAVTEIINVAKQKQIESLQLIFSEPNDLKPLISVLFTQIFLADYSFDKYKEKKVCSKLVEIQLVLHQVSLQYEMIMQESLHIAKAVILTRDLVNEPSNVIFPQTLAEEIEKIGNEAGFSVTIFNETEIKALKMHAFLSVAQGSKKPPRLIVLKYTGNPENSSAIFGLVGKGLTYDSGGYSIKPTEGMFTMKADMAGAASVIGAMYVIAKQKLHCNVTAVIAACENLISGEAYKPGEIISSMSGKTIEIGNTDAEGRLTLVDAIFYAIEKEKVTKIVDVATLTGAVVIGLGNVRTGVISNDDVFYHELEKAAGYSLERFWRLPSDEDYKELLKSEIADISNTGGKMAGTITAGLFIKHFLPREIPWLHLDIAGTAYQTKKTSNSPYGATGVPVSTLYYLAKLFSNK